MPHPLVAERVAHAGMAVPQRIRELVHPDQQRALRHVGMYLQPGEALERWNTLAGQVGHQIHLALFQGAQPVVV